jgi:hypothetical protein
MSISSVQICPPGKPRAKNPPEYSHSREDGQVPIASFETQDTPLIVWGSTPREFNRVHFSELLPALFERTLRFESLSLGSGALSWVFTGRNAGFTVILEASGVRLQQAFYDSYGLSFDRAVEDPSLRSGIERFPQRIIGEKTFPLNGEEIESLTVRLDAQLAIRVCLNGKNVLEQKCVFDVTQHQLQFGGDCKATGKLTAPRVKRAEITLDPDIKHQAILGFGGITSIPSYHMLGKEGKARWWRLLKDYNLLIHREYPPGLELKPDLGNWDHLPDARPHYYGDNFPNGEIVDFDYNRQIVEMGGTTWFEFWLLPEWIKAEQHEADTLLEKEGLDVREFCRAVVDYCRKSLEKSGAPPSIVGIQNERCQPTTVLNELVPALRRELDAAGFSSVKLQMSNAGTLEEAKKYLPRFQQCEETWQSIDYAASNVYDSQGFFFGDLEPYGKALEAFAEDCADRDKIAGEIAIQWGRFQINSYRMALRMAELNHYLLTCFQARALCYCWLLLHTPQPSFAWTRSLCHVDLSHGGVPEASGYLLRTFGAFSRRLTTGFQRVECGSDESDLLASTYLHKENEAGTLVLINRGTHPLDTTVTLPRGMGSDIQAESCSLYSANFPASTRIQYLEKERLRIQIEPGEIITLYSGAIPG